MTEHSFKKAMVNPRETTECEDKAIVKSTIPTPNSSLSTIQRVTGILATGRTIDRRLKEQHLSSPRPSTIPLPGDTEKRVSSGSGLSLTEVELLTAMSPVLK